MNTFDLLTRIENHLTETGMAKSTFGRMAINDPNLVDDLRNGRSVTLETAHDLIKFMSDYAPTARVNGHEGSE